jgi:hypothetical protein
MQNDREEPKISELDEGFLSSVEDDRSVSGKSPRTLIAAISALLLVVAVVWFAFRPAVEAPVPSAASPSSPVKAAEPVLAPALDIPVPEPAPEPEQALVSEGEEVPPAEPALTLDDSDEAVRETLGELGSPDLFSGLVSQSDVLLRGIALIDGLSRGLILNKILSLPRPVDKFSTHEVQGQHVIDPSSYQRYDPYAQAIAELDTVSMVAAFHSFRPLLELAYAQLGYQAAEFDNAVIRALDLVIATPEIRGEIPLKGKGALYQFADPDLEKLSPLQKQLLRMGPDNAELVRVQARALRSGLLGE